MQNRYTGDIGDYAKYGLLRALSNDGTLGVAWYLHPDEDHNDDGKYTEHLKPEQCHAWRGVDEKLFDVLKGIVENDNRCVAGIKESGILGDAVFADEVLSTELVNAKRRAEWRKAWFERVRKKMQGCPVVFIDPDNGLCDTDKFRYGGDNDSWKRLPLNEAQRLIDGRSGSARHLTIIYHHNTRRKGGHECEIEYWMKKLPGCTCAFRCRRGSSRTFFVINADKDDVVRLEEFAETWKKAEVKAGCYPPSRLYGPGCQIIV